MNNDRRKQIRAVSNVVEGIKIEIDVLTADEEQGRKTNNDELANKEEQWSGQIEDAWSDLESAKDDETEYKDSMPESLQGGERYDNAESCIEAMDRALDHLEELKSVEKVGELVKMFHEKYDDLISALDDSTT